MARTLLLPEGYRQFRNGATTVVAPESAVEAFTQLLTAHRTLRQWAAAHPSARPFEGRTTAWSAPLPGGIGTVVVRHAQHGGALARLTGDRFQWPGRAPHELRVAHRLHLEGVPTPEVVGFALYPSGPGLCRCDVATRLLPAGADFPEAWALTSSDAERMMILERVAALLRELQSAGARHADLNLKNVYISAALPRLAWALDVDRVSFGAPCEPLVAEQNLARLLRSARKWRDTKGLQITEEQLAQLSAMAVLS